MAPRAVLLAVLLLAGSAAAGLGGSAAAAEQVELRSDCPPDASDTCFVDLHSLDRWLWQVRRPSPESPVRVEVGAGDFRGRLSCRGQGHVTLRGEGASKSRLVGTVDEFPFATILVDDCTALRFERLAVIAPSAKERRGKAVRWRRGGDSTWRDVVLEAEYIAWYESGCAAGNELPPTGEHLFERVTIRAGALAYFSDCGRGRLTDSELAVRAGERTWLPSLSDALDGVVAGLKVSHRARARLLRCRVSVDSQAAAHHVPTVGLVAGADGNEHPEGAGRIEMEGGTLHVAGRGPAPVLAAQAQRFGVSDALAASIEIVGTILDVRRDGTPVREPFAGDGRIEASAAER